MKGNTIPRKISVDYMSFSAHVDYSQNSEFMELVKPQHIVSARCDCSYRGLVADFMQGLGARRGDRHGASEGCDAG